MVTKREELYNDLSEVLAPLVLLADISIAHNANTEVMIHADELAQVLNQMVIKIRKAQEKLYQ